MTAVDAGALALGDEWNQARYEDAGTALTPTREPGCGAMGVPAVPSLCLQCPMPSTAQPRLLCPVPVGCPGT